MLRVKLFGVPQFSLDEEPFGPLFTGRSLALFAYLMARTELCPRSALTDLLWDEKSDQQAREYLRGLLSTLRRVVGDYVLITRQTVAFNWQMPHWADITALGSYLSIDQPTLDPLLHRQTLQLYQGPFLDGFYLQNAPNFEVWLAAQRHQWHMQVWQGWQQLARYYLANAQYPEGLGATRQVLALEPWHEEAHRLQMLLLARNGEQSAALAHYAHCCQILRDEVDAPPSHETVALYEQIKAGHWSPATATAIQILTTEPRPPVLFTNGQHENGQYTNGQYTNGQYTNGQYTNGQYTNGQHERKNGVNHGAIAVAPAVEKPLPALSVDWGAMPYEAHFYGREAELAALYRWAVAERCRVITLLGPGGQGKSALAVRFIRTLAASANPHAPTEATTPSFASPTAGAPPFERIIWRSLLTAPLVTDIVQDWLQQLSNQQVVTFPRTLDQQFALLYEYLQQRRFLLVLDNVESILQPDGSGACRPGYEEYEHLWQFFVQRDQQCCLLLTSRERPRVLSSHEEQQGALRTLLLDGLSLSEGQQFLRAHRIIAQEAVIVALLRFYSGNPLALKLVADTIDELFAGDVAAFLQEETPFFAGIGAVLEQQFARLSPLELELLTWLALEQEPVTSQTLWDNLVTPPLKRDYLTALRALVCRSLVQPQGERFSSQNVILEYTRNRLVHTISAELTSDQPLHADADRWQATPKPGVLRSTFNRYALLKAHHKEYIRTSQRRLVVEPVARHWLAYWGETGVAAFSQQVLAELRSTRQVYVPLADGYAASNLLQLLLHLNIDLHGYDFSQLTLRQACLRNAVLQEVNFALANFQDCRFTDMFAPVTALAFHPNGEWLAIGAYDGQLRLVRTLAQEVYRILPSHPRALWGLAFSPDGTLLATICIDQQVRVWDLQTNTVRYSVRATTNFARIMAFSPQQCWLATSGGGGRVNLYNAATGELQHTLQSTSAYLRSIAFSPNGRWLVAGDEKGKISLWEIDLLSCNEAGAPTVLDPICTFVGHNSPVNTLGFRPDSQVFFSGGDNDLIHMWQVTPLPTAQPGEAADQSRLPWRTLVGHQNGVRDLAISPNGRLLASAGADHTVRLWDAQEGALLETLTGHEQWVRAVAFHPRPTAGTQLLASGGNDQRVLFWAINTQEGINHCHLHQSMAGYSDAISSVAFMPNGRGFISGGCDKLVHLWAMPSGQHQATLCGHHEWIFRVAASPDGQWIASSGYENHIYLWAAAPDKTVAHPRSPLKLCGHTGSIWGLAFSPDGQILASGGRDSTIRLWEVSSGRLVQTLTGHTGWVWSVAFSPDGRRLASASFDQTVRLWDVQELATEASDNASTPDATPTSNRLIQIFTGHTGWVWEVAFSPDGQTLISVSHDQTVRLWDVTGRECRVFTGHTSTVRGLAVSPACAEGHYLFATSDDDKLIRLWHGQSGEVLAILQGHHGVIHGLAFNPAGTTLVSVSQEGDICLWDVQTGVLVQTLRAPRPYTGMDITGVTGITPVQKAALLALGALEKTPASVAQCGSESVE